MKRNRTVLADCLRKNRLALVLYAAGTLLNGCVFSLYQVFAEPFLYAQTLLTVLLLFLLGLDFRKEKKAAKVRERGIHSIAVSGIDELGGTTLRDQDYKEMLQALLNELEQVQAGYAASRQADEDYYSTWVHQIKTPIAVMKLQLAEDTEENKALRAELFRIEQYVEMVLDYNRLESSVNDLVIREYAVDEILRETVRKFAPQLILRKLRLCYEADASTVVTDKKWLGFIVEQLISNAIKYTPTGEVGIQAKGNWIQIRDTGIGIAPEDLPRIFEKGYTGVNGRLGQKSSGLGLFLTKKAADLLAVRITAESKVGAGSTFTIHLPAKDYT